MPTTQPVILAVGELLWDLFPTGARLGGAPFNFIYHAAQFGADAHGVSTVGDDDLGRQARAQLAAAGVDLACVSTDSAHPTGTVTVVLDAQGKPTYTINENAAWDFVPLTRPVLDVAARADAVCYGSLAQRSAGTRRTIREVLRATSRTCLRVFDINLRLSFYDRETIETTLAQSTILKLNNEELDVLAGLFALPGDEEARARALLARHRLTLVAVTRGGEGSSLYTADGQSHVPGEKVAVVNTVGAGDAFTAGLVVGLLRRMPLDRINRLASQLAAYVCTQDGATPSLPVQLTAPFKTPS